MKEHHKKVGNALKINSKQILSQTADIQKILRKFALQTAVKLKILYKHILKSFLKTFVLTFFICIFVLILQFLWLEIDELAGKGLELDIIVKLLFHTSVTFVPTAFPLAILMSSLMTFGNLGEYYELVAVKSGGISLWQVMKPLFILCIVFSVTAFVFSNDLLPVATLKAKSLLHDVRQKKLAFDIKEGIFYHDIDDYVIRAEKKSPDGNSIYNIKIYDHKKKRGNTSVIVADSGRITLSKSSKKIIFKLYNGCNYTDLVDAEDYKSKTQFERMTFDEQILKFDIADFDLTRTREDLFKSHYSMLNISQLSHSIDSLEKRYDKRKSTYEESFTRRFNNLLAARSTGKEPPTWSDTNTKLVTELKFPIMTSFPENEHSSIIIQANSLCINTMDNISFNKRDFKSQQSNIKRYQQVEHKKFTLSIACLLFFFIGAPLGAIIRKGGLGFPIVISVLFFVFYYVISISLERVAIAGGTTMIIGVWTSSIILLPIGIFLTYKAGNDAPLFDEDNWSRTTNTISHLFAIKRKS